MASSSQNQQTTAVRGGTGATATPANTGAAGLSSDADKPSVLKQTTEKIGGTQQGVGTGVLGKVAGEIKDTLGTSK